MELFEGLTARKAAERLHHCLHPNKRDKLSWPQIKLIFRMARDRGGVAGINAMLAESGYRTTEVEPNAERAAAIALEMDAVARDHERRMAALLRRAQMLKRGR
ncbi:MAG: hypothetical protein U5P41_07405 [Gammaproteobacteria bacterium]|nr:hypothetical protein [Gammaproteobacteria bacterium]